MTSSISRSCLMLFARYPEAGKVKTRLIPAVGGEGAACIYQEMAEYTLHQARAVASTKGTALQLWFTGGNQDALRHWLGPDLTYYAQPEGDLGTRLMHAFQSVFDQGYRAVIAIGTDCPALDSGILIQALESLENHELVLGPATDGGYYLIGLRRPIPELFRGIAWSTAEVLQQTEAIAEQLSLSRYRLASLTDIDNPEDLVLWQQIKESSNR
jgi:hypothetical protein